jgi:hypothetical protein
MVVSAGILAFFLVTAPSPFDQGSARRHSGSGKTVRPKSGKPRPPPAPATNGKAASDEDDEAEEPGEPVSSARRRRAPSDDSEASGDDEETVDRPMKKRRVARRSADSEDEEEEGGEESEEEEEDYDDEDAPIQSMPPVMPRMAWAMAGGVIMGRSFSYGSAYQNESSFGRVGGVLNLETFPLMRLSGWVKRFGLGASYGLEMGRASKSRPADMGGGSISYPVKQGRWSVDIRYVFTPGKRLAVIPFLGYGRQAWDLERPAVAPSACGSATADPCLPDTYFSYGKAGIMLRLAASAAWGVSLGLQVMPGISVSKGTGRLAAEADVATLGYAVELGVSRELTNWLAVHAFLPYTRFGHTFSAPSAGTYSSATEAYYGLILGVAAHTR